MPCFFYRFTGVDSSHRAGSVRTSHSSLERLCAASKIMVLCISGIKSTRPVRAEKGRGAQHACPCKNGRSPDVVHHAAQRSRFLLKTCQHAIPFISSLGYLFVPLPPSPLCRRARHWIAVAATCPWDSMGQRAEGAASSTSLLPFFPLRW